MKTQKSFESEKATLYIVSTPIGNLSDMTYRGVEILSAVSTVYAEDTRQSRKLFEAYGIDTPLRSLHAHNEKQRVEELTERLNAGDDLALISDAGTPLLSDPGSKIVTQVSKRHPVVAVPGANALLPALITSGLSPHPFLFYGFPPQKASARKRVFASLALESSTLVFYLSPHRFHAALEDMFEVFGNRRICVARELTKRFEEIHRLDLKEALELPEQKGELTVVIEGASEDIAFREGDLVEHVTLLIEDGHPEKEAIKLTAKQRNIKKNKVYMAYQHYKSQVKE